MVLVILLVNEVLGSQCYTTSPSAFVTVIDDDLSFHGLRSALVTCTADAHPSPHTAWTLLSLSFWCFSFPFAFFSSLNSSEICVLPWTLPVLGTEGYGYFRAHPDLNKQLYFAFLLMTENSHEIPAFSGHTWRLVLTLWPVWVSKLAQWQDFVTCLQRCVDS